MDGHMHVFAADATQTPDQAWAELCVFGRRVTFSGLDEYWVTYQCDGSECANIEWAPEARHG